MNWKSRNWILIVMLNRGWRRKAMECRWKRVEGVILEKEFDCKGQFETLFASFSMETVLNVFPFCSPSSDFLTRGNSFRCGRCMLPDKVTCFLPLPLQLAIERLSFGRRKCPNTVTWDLMFDSSSHSESTLFPQSVFAVFRLHFCL